MLDFNLCNGNHTLDECKAYNDMRTDKKKHILIQIEIIL